MSSLARPLASLALCAPLALGAATARADEPEGERARAPSVQLEGEGMALRWPTALPGAAFALSLAPAEAGVAGTAALVETRTWGPLGASLRLGLETGPSPTPTSAASAWLDRGALALSVELVTRAPTSEDPAPIDAQACLVLRRGRHRFIAFATYDAGSAGTAAGMAWALPAGSW